MTLRLIRTIEDKRLDARDAELQRRAANDADPLYFVLFDEPRCSRGWTLQYFENRRLADAFAAGRMLHGGPAKIVRVGP